MNINLTQPLKRGIRLQLEEKKDVTTLPLRYERLLDFYYYCGHLGHLYHECVVFCTTKNAETSMDFKFKPSLKVKPPVEKRQNQNSDIDKGAHVNSSPNIGNHPSHSNPLDQSHRFTVPTTS